MRGTESCQFTYPSPSPQTRDTTTHVDVIPFMHLCTLTHTYQHPDTYTLLHTHTHTQPIAPCHQPISLPPSWCRVRLQIHQLIQLSLRFLPVSACLPSRPVTSADPHAGCNRCLYWSGGCSSTPPLTFARLHPFSDNFVNGRLILTNISKYGRK